MRDSADNVDVSEKVSTTRLINVKRKYNVGVTAEYPATP